MKNVMMTGAISLVLLALPLSAADDEEKSKTVSALAPNTVARSKDASTPRPVEVEPEWRYVYSHSNGVRQREQVYIRRSK